MGVGALGEAARQGDGSSVFSFLFLGTSDMSLGYDLPYTSA